MFWIFISGALAFMLATIAVAWIRLKNTQESSLEWDDDSIQQELMNRVMATGKTVIATRDEIGNVTFEECD